MASSFVPSTLSRGPLLVVLAIMVIVNGLVNVPVSIRKAIGSRAAAQNWRPQTYSPPTDVNGRSASWSSSMAPLHTNPRRIDVGEETMSKFGKDLIKHDLLTAEDEVALARQYRLGTHVEAHGRKLKDERGHSVTAADIGDCLDVPASQVSLLIERGQAAKKALVRANMRLVFHMAKYYRYRGLSYPDLVQEGTFGLMKAVDRYDPDRGFRFSTYASWWIKQSVSRAIAEKSRIVRLPVHIHDLMVSMSRAEKQFTAEHARKPNNEELAERLALPLQKVELLKRCGRDVNSMDESAYTDNSSKGPSTNEVQVKDRLQSDETEPLILNERNSQRQELRRAMRSLTEREAQIVEMRFGLADGNPMTLEDIGKQFNVTRERIRQIEARALSKMRHPNKAGELKEIFNDDPTLAAQVAMAQQLFENSHIIAATPTPSSAITKAKVMTVASMIPLEDSELVLTHLIEDRERELVLQ